MLEPALGPAITAPDRIPDPGRPPRVGAELVPADAVPGVNDPGGLDLAAHPVARTLIIGGSAALAVAVTGLLIVGVRRRQY